MLLKNNSNRRKYEFVRNWPRYHFWPCQDAHSGKRWLPLECNDGFFPNVWIWVVEIRSPTPAFPKMWLEFLSMQLLMKFTRGKNVRACRMGLHTNLWQNIFDFIDLRKHLHSDQNIRPLAERWRQIMLRVGHTLGKIGGRGHIESHNSCKTCSAAMRQNWKLRAVA